MKAVCQNDAERTIYGKLVEEYVFLERRMDELLKLPQIKIHPDDPSRQKTTPAHKQYKELLQQYTNIAKILGKINGAEEENEDSPLRAWAKKRMSENAH